jgi:hypothetical protein
MSIEFTKDSHEWLHENGRRAIFTLVDLDAEDGTVIPHDSIAYVCGASSSNGRVDTIRLEVSRGSKQPAQTVMVQVQGIGSIWDWNQGDGRTQVVASELLNACRDLCVAAFEAPDEERRKDLLLSLYRNLQSAIGTYQQPDNPIVAYARGKWLK